MSGFIKRSIVLLVFLVPVLLCRGQEYRATARLDSTTVLIGDQFTLNLSFSYPAGAQVLWPSIKDTILGNILVIDRTPVDTARSADSKILKLTQKLKLTCFDSGFYTIPSIRFYYRVLPDTTVKFAQTDLQMLTVHTVSVDTTQAIKPIKGPVKIPVSWTEYLLWILAGMAFVAILGFFVYYFFFRKRGEPLFVLRPKVKYLPHETALMALEKLRTRKLWQSGKVKEYHTEITDILRKYVEERFGLSTLESTTGEILDDLRALPFFPATNREQLDEILTRADLVKFARYEPGPAENEKSLEEAAGFVTSTFGLQDQPGDVAGPSVMVPPATAENAGAKVEVKPEKQI